MPSREFVMTSYVQGLIDVNQAQPFTEEELRAQRAKAVATNNVEVKANQSEWRAQVILAAFRTVRSIQKPSFLL
jgi:hypothetical protein